MEKYGHGSCLLKPTGPPSRSQPQLLAFKDTNPHPSLSPGQWSHSVGWILGIGVLEKLSR